MKSREQWLDQRIIHDHSNSYPCICTCSIAEAPQDSIFDMIMSSHDLCASSRRVYARVLSYAVTPLPRRYVYTRAHDGACTNAVDVRELMLPRMPYDVNVIFLGRSGD